MFLESSFEVQVKIFSVVCLHSGEIVVNTLKGVHCMFADYYLPGNVVLW